MLPRPSFVRGVLLFTCLLAPALALAQLRYTQLDIGQGDSSVLITPSGCVALFDAGPTGTGDIIKNSLRSQGVTRVDVAFVSHFHADHLGSMDEVEQGTDGVPVSLVYDRGGSYSSTAFTDYNNQFGNRRRTATLGQVINLCSEVQLEVVAVNANGRSTSDENAKSVTVKITYGAFNALVGGDLTGEGDSAPDIESLIASTVGEVELYKVHHHCSDTSSGSGFLNAIKPLTSFISLGINNTYGHPTPGCLSRLAAVNSAVWQTEDPATGTKRGHISLSSHNGGAFTVTQGSNSVTYLSKGGGDTQPPSAPGNLVASAASSTEVSLGWSAATDDLGVKGYRVYRSTNGSSFTLAGSPTTTSFVDMGLSPSTTYWYRVTAVDVVNKESAASNTVSVTTQAAAPALVFINEILANEPGSTTAGEFIEVVNAGGTAINIGGWTLSDAVQVRHTFAAGTTLAAGKAVVVFAGAAGIPQGLTNAVAASTGQLSLNNTTDTVTLKNGATTVDTFSYGSGLASQDGVSMNRSPDVSRTGTFVLHNTLTLLSNSPGTRANGGTY